MGVAREVLKKVNMEDAKTVNCSLANHFNISIKQSPSTDEEREEMNKVPST